MTDFMHDDNFAYYGNMTHTFTEVVYQEATEEEEAQLWNNPENFIADWKTGPFYAKCPTLNDGDINLIYYLLYTRYGNSHIASNDETRFKYQLYSLIYQYYPTAKKKLEIQDKLRALDLDSGDLFKGTAAIYNTALHDQTAPGTSTTDELTYINQQNTTNYKKSKMSAYQELWTLLTTNVTNEFLNKFAKLFVIVATPGPVNIYC